MAVHIRLARHGSKKNPFYRIVVTDHRNARVGRFLERIGTFDPRVDNGLKIDRERLSHWQGQGALTSHTLGRVLSKTAPATSA
jgi:small subunit ribosomal protein S16